MELYVFAKKREGEETSLKNNRLQKWKDFKQY